MLTKRSQVEKKEKWQTNHSTMTWSEYTLKNILNCLIKLLPGETLSLSLKPKTLTAWRTNFSNFQNNNLKTVGIEIIIMEANLTFSKITSSKTLQIYFRHWFNFVIWCLSIKRKMIWNLIKIFLYHHETEMDHR